MKYINKTINKYIIECLLLIILMMVSYRIFNLSSVRTYAYEENDISNYVNFQLIDNHVSLNETSENYNLTNKCTSNVDVDLMLYVNVPIDNVRLNDKNVDYVDMGNNYYLIKTFTLHKSEQDNLNIAFNVSNPNESFSYKFFIS